MPEICTEAVLGCLDTLGDWAAETKLPATVEQHQQRCLALRHKLLKALVSWDTSATARATHDLCLEDRVRGGNAAETDTSTNPVYDSDLGPEEPSVFESEESKNQRQRVLRQMAQHEENKRPMPESFARFTILSLGGPLAYTCINDEDTEKVEGFYLALTWVVLGATGGLCVAWTAGRTLFSIDASLSYATYMWGLFSVVTVLGACYSMIWLWVGLRKYDPEIVNDVHYKEGDPATFFGSIMAMKIDKDAQRSINSKRIRGWIMSAVIMILFESFIGWLWLDWDELTNGADMPWDMYAGMVVGFILCPIWTLGFTRSSIVLPEILVQCLGVRAAEIAAQISQPAWPRTASDYDDLLSDIDRFTMRTRKLSEALGFTCVVYPIILGVLAASFFFSLALGPRPPHESGHWFNETVTESRCILLAVACSIFGFYTLFLPAHLTEQCRKIEKALSTNRIKKESGEVKFAKIDNLIRIHGLERLMDIHQVGFCKTHLQLPMPGNITGSSTR